MSAAHIMQIRMFATRSDDQLSGNIRLLPMGVKSRCEKNQTTQQADAFKPLALGSLPSPNASDARQERQQRKEDNERVHQSRTTVTNKISEADSANNESQRARLMMLLGL